MSSSQMRHDSQVISKNTIKKQKQLVFAPDIEIDVYCDINLSFLK